ncbi:hypothetical protein A4X13_0g6896 [Tilletia indica]|uniref:JmjC domain-containing protein n=1 Tax=Tilletia indica TaxID=43049 RepID=A0A8T8SM99_9BASI|nr:hypothetical protein A4X13_0g6896 [Tilletia indica]
MDLDVKEDDQPAEEVLSPEAQLEKDVTKGVRYIDQDGNEPKHAKKLGRQREECRDEPTLPKKYWCKVCWEQADRVGKGQALSGDFECSFRHVRVLDYGVKEGGVGGGNVVPGTWVHEPLKREGVPFQDVAGSRGLADEYGGFQEEMSVCFYKLALAAVPFIEEELRHASQTDRHVFQRRAAITRDLRQCGQCQSFMIGCWQCRTCGNEVCLACYEAVVAFSRANPGQLVRDVSLHACRVYQGRQWNPHGEADFSPIARRSVQEWVVLQIWGRHLIQHYEEKSNNAMKTMLDEFRADFRQRPPKADQLAHTRDDVDGAAYLHRARTPVLRLRKETKHVDRVRAVLRAVLSLNTPFVVQQDMVAPLSDVGLKELIPQDTPVDVRRVGARDDEVTEVDDVWTWKRLVKELCGVTASCDWLDVRDFPKSTDLSTLSQIACDFFQDTSQFPSAVNEAWMPVDKRLKGMGDLGGWSNIPFRDGKEKCYAALKSVDSEDHTTTNLHVDEAGAANVLMWVRLEPGENVMFKETGKVTDLDDLPVGAEWLWWAPEARQYFEEAAEICRKEKTGKSWEGSVLFGNDYTANEAFIDKVAKLGGKDCRAHRIRQRVGETVYIPAGVPHQVKNVRPCFKIARDLMPPTQVEQMLAVQREGVRACEQGKWRGRDACMLKPCLYKSLRAVVGYVMRGQFNGEKPSPNAAVWANELAVVVKESADRERNMRREIRSLAERVEALEARPPPTLSDGELHQALMRLWARAKPEDVAAEGL